MASGISSWSTVAATNATASSNINFAENQAASTVNDSARGLMKEVADFVRDGGWIQFGDQVHTYVSGTSTKISGSDYHAYYMPNRRVRLVAGGTTIYGRVSDSTFSVDTQITYQLNDGGSLSNTTYAVSVALHDANTIDPKLNAINLGTVAANTFPKYESTNSVTFVAITSPTLAPASEAEMADHSLSTSVYATPFNLNSHPGAAKAWMVFSGGNPPTVLDSYACSIARNGTGDYTMTFDRSFASTSYVGLIGAGNGAGTVAALVSRGPAIANPTETTFRFVTYDIAGIATDFVWTSVMFFGRQ